MLNKRGIRTKYTAWNAYFDNLHISCLQRIRKLKLSHILLFSTRLHLMKIEVHKQNIN